jgi:hypothetical protein
MQKQCMAKRGGWQEPNPISSYIVPSRYRLESQGAAVPP